jgi:CubicO group peptidase (beta-lactamase class C family)
MADLKTATRRIAGAGLIVSALTAQANALDNQTHVTHEVSSEKLECFLSEHVTDKFSGALLIAQNGKVIHEQAYGFANRENSTLNALDTVFETGVLTRYFTATAILKLVEKNKLSLDDTLTKFFNNVPESKRDITIHHLLTHTSGLFGDEDLDAFKVVDTDSFLDDVFSRSNSISPAVYLPVFTFQAGDRLIEFDEGYNLLAQIIEKRSGQSFEAFLNDQLFKPLGMEMTGYQIPDWKPEQLANGYLNDSESWGNLPERLISKNSIPPYMRGSMGLLSTVEDLYTWHQALYAGKIIREDLVELLHTRHIGMTVNDEADVDYGYGIELSETWTGTSRISNINSSVVEANLPAFTTGYNYFPEDKTLIIFATNDAQVSREFEDTLLILIRTLLEPNYQPVLVEAGNQ